MRSPEVLAATAPPAAPRTPATLHGLVEARAAHGGHRPAVVDGRRVLRLGQLDRRATVLAPVRRRAGVADEEPVALCCRRSAELAVGFLAVLKAGAACVPLDPDHPAERIRFAAADAGVRVVVTQPDLAHLLAGRGRVTVLADAMAEDSPVAPEPLAAAAAGPDGLAYVLYTSGSTGTPKGVALTHRGLANHTRAMARLFGLGPDDRVLQFASPAFDLSVEELFPTWHAGAAAVLRPPDLPVLGAPWLRWLEEAGITVMDLPTGYWERWVHDLARSGRRVPAALRLLVVGGEQPSPRAFATWLDVGGDRVRWLNTYGPTEASVVATWHEPRRQGVDRIPIGRPIDGVTAHVLDGHMVPVADGVVGELYLGGVGVARGYLGRPDLTAEAFPPDPFVGDGGRLFRTGDRARRLADGDLEFLGRLDDLVKVRGARVEPGEVEHALASHPAVCRAAVVAREEPGGQTGLVAYCVAPGGMPSPSALRAHLRTTLPDQLVPSAFVAVDDLPLTPNGKRDRGALPCPPSRRPALAVALVPPRGRTEEVVASAWAEVLGLDEVGVHDDFFDLGGHSLLALQVSSLVGERLGLDLPAGAVLDSPTVARLAGVADATGPPLRPVWPPVPVAMAGAGRSGPVPLSLQQEWMWALEAGADPPGLYNVTVHRRLDGPVDGDALRGALRLLVERHEGLRTVYPTTAAGPCGVVRPAHDPDTGESDLGAAPPAAREAALRRALAEVDARPFDLAAGPGFRAHLFRLGDGGPVEVALTCDHLVADGISVDLLLHELGVAYASLRAGRRPPLPPLAVRYADYARWQRRWVTGEVLERETAYWRRTLAGMPAGPGVAFDRRPERPERGARTVVLEIPDATYAGLAALARSARSSLFPVCVAAVQAVVAHHTGSADVVVSTMLGGRARRELEGVVGLFAGVARLRTRSDGAAGFAAHLELARAALLGAVEHANVPFGRVRAALVADGGADPAARPHDLPVDVQYFPASWGSWPPGTAALARHPRHGRGSHTVARGQRHPLRVDLFDDRRELWAVVSYRPAFYDEATVEGFARQLGAVLAAAAERPDAPVGRVLDG